MESLYWAPVPVAARSKAWVCGCSIVGVAGSNPTGGGMDCWMVKNEK